MGERERKEEVHPMDPEEEEEEERDREGELEAAEEAKGEQAADEGVLEEIDPLDPEEEEEEAADGAQAALADAEADEGLAAPSKPKDKPQVLGRPCFVYDRPPRTGSTTVSRALKSCLLAQGFRQPLLESRWVRILLVTRMLALDDDKVGLISKHMYMNGEDIRRMRAECGKLVYVSSCKPMRERLWSAAKYRFSDGNVNSSLTEEMKESAVTSVAKDMKTEPFLEDYPYLGKDERANGTPESERMTPDYVIRAEFMDDDLGKLLRALGCESGFDSKNVHKADEERKAFLKRLPLRRRDETFEKLNRLAKQGNEKGLRKIKDFL